MNLIGEIMELRQLKTFQTVARLLSFHRAAQVLNYAQSTVSTQIRLLEEELGVPLFDRLGKRIQLTEAGLLLLRYSGKMLDMEKETLEKVAGREEPGGKLSLRIPQSISTYLLPPILKKFQAACPRAGLDAAACAYETLIQELKSGVIDLAFLLAESIPFQELKSELLAVEELVLVSNPEHPLALKAAVQVRDLSGATILLPKHDCSYAMMFQRILTEEKVEPATIMELNSIEAIKQCVENGIGVAMMPRMALREEVAQKRLTILNWPEEKLETGILMIWHRDKWLSPHLQLFMNLVREEIKSPAH